MPRKCGTQGFTLIEVLITVAILSLVTLVAAPKVHAAMLTSQQSREAGDLRQIDQALDRHYNDLGYYPNKLNDLTKRGYVRQGFRFRSPVNNLPYFYAVDDNRDGKQPQQYVLGKPAQPMGSRHVLPRSGPLPAGRDPSYRAWAWHYFTDLSSGFELLTEDGSDTLPMAQIPTSLSGYHPELVTN